MCIIDIRIDITSNYIKGVAMHRFFVLPEQINNGCITITGDDLWHLSKVLRLREGDAIIVCDSNGTDYECKISKISKTEAIAQITQSYPNNTEPPINVTIYQGLPKSDKMDYIVQKCVELGAIKIVPVITKRAVAVPRDDGKKIARWQKIASEAAKQCGRGVLPTICECVKFEQALKEIAHDDALNLIPYENEKCSKLRDALKNSKTNINIFIGPEGGFDESEIELAMSKNIKPVTLGPRILRTETAPLAVLASVMYELGDW